MKNRLASDDTLLLCRYRDAGSCKPYRLWTGLELDMSLSYYTRGKSADQGKVHLWFHFFLMLM